jgi:hypothetical protein
MNREQVKQIWLEAEIKLAREHGISVEELRRRVARDLEIKEARRLGIDPAMIVACDTATMQGIAMRDNRAPSGPSFEGIIRAGHQPLSSVHSGRAGVFSSDNGWVRPRALGNPPGTEQADRIVDEFDRRDKAELAERLARTK